MITEKLTHSGRSTAITHEQQSGISHGRRILDNPWDAQPLSMPPIRPSFADISVTPEQFLSLLDSLDSSVVSRNDVLPVCLSDFDGTLTSGASGSKIFEYGANTDFFLEQVRPEINKTLHFFSMAPHFGVPESAVVGMNLEVDSAGRFTTQIRPPMTFREGKDEAARSLLASFRKDRSAAARPLFAMGDSPAKSDQQMLEMAHVALFAEPQTAHDSEYARELIHQGRRALIVDYESTVEGGPVTLFNRHLETQMGPKGRFL